VDYWRAVKTGICLRASDVRKKSCRSKGSMRICQGGRGRPVAAKLELEVRNGLTGSHRSARRVLESQQLLKGLQEQAEESVGLEKGTGRCGQGTGHAIGCI